MVPKTHFKYSLKKGDDVATNVPTPHGRWVTHNSEKISLDHLFKQTTSSGASGSHCKVIDQNPPIIPSNESMETYPLHFVEPQDTLTVTDLQGPPPERTPEEKLWDFKTRAQQYARDRRSCDDVRISYLEFLETEAEDDLALARMIAG
jgi:hypothetical protein